MPEKVVNLFSLFLRSAVPLETCTHPDQVIKRKLKSVVNQNLYFSFLQYLGRWYEYSKYFALFEIFGTCTNAVYTDQTPEGSANIVIGVHNMGIDRM